MFIGFLAEVITVMLFVCTASKFNIYKMEISSIVPF